MNAHLARWSQVLATVQGKPLQVAPYLRSGRITRATGMVLEAVGLRLPLGGACRIELTAHEGVYAEAEVVGFAGDTLYLMPLAEIHGLQPGARVFAADDGQTGAGGNRNFPLGMALLGRVLDSGGQPLDGRGPLLGAHHAGLHTQPLNPLKRAPIDRQIDVGIRAINALLCVGRGQRLGLFAGSGVGKSVLLGMMARYTQADVIVVGLIGERGREVQEFIEDILGDDGRARSVVVAAPADAPPLLRMQGAAYATAVAEHFRDKGKHVLLLMDSLTRYAMAQREIALAIGEPPATKGYPPSCFAKLTQLVERSGNGLNGVGSITAFYTVLSEGDDQQDPIADAARAILDGHIVLSRTLAEAGHYPAIDIEQSASRVMHNVVSPIHIEVARRFKAMYSRYQKSRDLIQVGAYVQGSDPDLDEAIQLQRGMAGFLQQDMHEAVNLQQALDQMAASLGLQINP